MTANSLSHIPLAGLSSASLRGWFSCAPGELATMLWVGGLHALALVAVILLPLPPLSALVVAAVLLLLGGLGTTVAYHRGLAHRAVALNPLVEGVLIACAMANGSGNPRNWVGVHRHHHAHSDRAGDISSPNQGFWWAHLRWLWQSDQRDAARYAPDLARRRYRVWTLLQAPLLACSLGLGALWFFAVPWPVALAAMAWIGPLRLLWALHVQCSVNSICHLGPVGGVGGSSRNVAWLTLAHMGQGENWHGNHHQRPGDARLGHGWQLDLGWWTIRLLAALGLARVRRAATADASESMGG